jgi:protein-disulfide isomerase
MRKAIATVAVLVAAFGAQTAPVKSRGLPNAPVMLEVYSDYECPHCKTLYEQTLVPLMADYVDKGKVYLIHHEFPLPMHAHALEAACYACAASRVGKYEQACEVLFRNQEIWSANGQVDATVCSILSPSEAKKVRELDRDPAIVNEVRQDIQTGQNAKVDTTPTVILTYRAKQYRIPGATSYAILHRFIDQLLSN